MLSALARILKPAEIFQNGIDNEAKRVAALTQLYERDEEFKALTTKQLHGALWGAFPSRAFNELLWRSQNPKGREQAITTLARWCASEGRYRDCVDLLNLLTEAPAENSGERTRERQLAILKLFALSQIGELGKAREISARLGSSVESDNSLIRAIVADSSDRLAILNEPFVSAGMPRVGSFKTATLLDGLQCFVEPVTDGPRLSVIMPAYNCAAVMPTAVRSVLAQTWRSLELIIVDDASTDKTYDVAVGLAATDPRISVLRQEKNQGAYAARNKGLRAATGAFVTVHDSDDWSHPCKFAMQISNLKENVICTTMGVRMTSDLQPIVKANSSAIFVENMSSLMGRTNDFRKLGGWDEVRVGADAEFYERIRSVFAVMPNVILPEVPLTFIRSEAGSLTQHKATGLKTINYGCRREYRDAYRAWHSSSTDYKIDGRAPFAAPRLITQNDQNYDLIAIMDFTNVDDEFVIEVEIHASLGRKVGISNKPAPTSATRPTSEAVRKLLTRPNVDIIVAGDEAWADMIIYPERQTIHAPEDAPSIHGVIRTKSHILRREIRERQLSARTNVQLQLHGH